MLVPNETLCLLHSSYQTAIQNLEKQWKFCEDAKSKIDLLIAFSNNFLMLPQLWSELYLLSEDTCSWEEQQKILKKAYFQFCYVNENSPGFTFQKLLHQSQDFSRSEDHLDVYKLSELNKIVKNFECPHKSLDASLRFYEEFISSPIKKDVLDRFERCKKLYDEILSSRNDLSLWFKNTVRANDETFIANNIEYRLGNNLNNLDLWKMYIDYLKDFNPTKLLTLYSKYCRYFTNDEDMKKEYQKATEIYGPSYDRWQNKFDFEMFGSVKKAEIPRETDELIKFSPIIKGEFSKFENQSFSLPKTLINYVLQHHKILQKLFKTCKYFFSKNRIPVVHNFLCKSLHWKEGVEFHEQSVAVFFPSMKRKFSDNSKIHFDHKSILSNSLNVTFHNNPNILSSSIIPNILRCYAKFIRLQNQNLTFKEFKFLTENDTVELLHLNKARIYKDDATFTSMEEILECVPKIIVFEIFSPITSSQTFEKLMKLEFVNKIYTFKMFNLKYFEPILFCDFLKKNLDNYANVAVRFDKTLYKNQEEYQKMKEMQPIFFEQLNKNWNIEERPKILYA